LDDGKNTVLKNCRAEIAEQAMCQQIESGNKQADEWFTRQLRMQFRGRQDVME
jgi:hypothetical protein